MRQEYAAEHYIHTYIYTYTCIHIPVYAYTLVCTPTHTHIYRSIYTHFIYILAERMYTEPVI